MTNAAETMRNPVGTTAPPSTSSTLRNAPSPGQAESSQSRSNASTPAGLAGGDTRPSKGSDALSPPSNKTFAPSGPVGSPGTPNGSVSGSGAGGGSPGLSNAAGANGGTTPAGQGALKSNGGTAASGSKAAPIQGNGVRKVQ